MGFCEEFCVMSMDLADNFCDFLEEDVSYNVMIDEFELNLREILIGNISLEIHDVFLFGHFPDIE